MRPVVAKTEVNAFWSELYRSAYANVDAALDGESLLNLLDETEAMFRYRSTMAVTEIDLGAIAGKTILEIGSGAGSHSALFAKYGALVTAVDLSLDRVRATARKFELLGELAKGCVALEADAENLPFEDSSFDIVYSNGVLHHSPDTERAISEVYRVLKPEGRAIVMLYCKSSINYWVTLWFGYGVLKGQLRHGVDRLGAASEWGGSERPAMENPITRCYTFRDMRRLFVRFDDLSLRKSEFAISHLPKIGKFYKRWLFRRGRVHNGGILPYGEPWPLANAFELWLGRHLGWAWYASATKRTEAEHKL